MRESRIWKIFIYTVYSVASLMVLLPVLFVIGVSFSSEADILRYGFSVFPKHFDLAAYQAIFKDAGELIWRIIWSIIVAVLGPLTGIVVSVGFSYAISRTQFFLSKAYNIILLITLFLPSSMISRYIVYSSLYGLSNNPIIYFLPMGIGVFGCAVYRSHFKGLPQELMEAASMEGASELQILWHIVVPMSKGLIGIQYVSGAMGMWNDYTTSLIYMNSNQTFQTLAHYINEVLKDSNRLVTAMVSAGMDVSDIPQNTMKFAIAVISMLPVLVVFPFVQKFFSKGVAVGSVKG